MAMIDDLTDKVQRLHDYLLSLNRAPIVLVVDDDQFDREQLTEVIWLVQPGTVIDEAKDGPSAIEAMFAKDYDLVFLDLRMAPMPGIEVMKQVKMHGRLPNIVTVSGIGNGVMVKEAMAEGVVLHITKPVTREIMEGVFRATKI